MNKLFRTVTDSIFDSNDDKVVQLSSIEDIAHQILIEELSIEMSIGILPEEKETKQTVIIDLTVDMMPKNSYEDDINETVSYADIVEKTQTLSTLKHYNLVETFAQDIAKMCFKYSAVQKIEVSVKKPKIMSGTKNVGFKLIQKRSA